MRNAYTKYQLRSWRVSSQQEKRKQDLQDPNGQRPLHRKTPIRLHATSIIGQTVTNRRELRTDLLGRDIRSYFFASDIDVTNTKESFKSLSRPHGTPRSWSQDQPQSCFGPRSSATNVRHHSILANKHASCDSQTRPSVRRLRPQQIHKQKVTIYQL